MSTKRTNSEAAVLEQYRVSIENAKKQPTISSIMTEYGYTPEVIVTGENLYSKTFEIYNRNKTEDDETSAAYATFSNQKDALKELYKTHRKKAKVVFKNEPVILDLLLLQGTQPGAYVKWMEMIKKFYDELTKSEELKNRLSRLKVPEEELNQASELISSTESARAEYLREVGESEDATQQKDAAFAKLDEWMSEFYAVAKIALEDHPQLLESLGKSIKS
ncbi:hypothetical protein ACRTDU_08310 [Sunxiuqinia elliptica]|uniref:Uncharacterized protein n=1 Tax=Sunxiuqinia elliptica TaxID=655355 RepID=A0A1I2I8G5_9BACT|nr:hypothetical protein [Sunxiuqinia elliptica]SFF36841.1 hypothetical protein SAMN05216283_105100 [Sunxiuqinia elliptica]